MLGPRFVAVRLPGLWVERCIQAPMPPMAIPRKICEWSFFSLAPQRELSSTCPRSEGFAHGPATASSFACRGERRTTTLVPNTKIGRPSLYDASRGDFKQWKQGLQRKPRKMPNCWGARRTAGLTRHNWPEIASIKNLYSIFCLPQGKVELGFPVNPLHLPGIAGHYGGVMRNGGGATHGSACGCLRKGCVGDRYAQHISRRRMFSRTMLQPRGAQCFCNGFKCISIISGISA